jgi:hypothetical protein
MAETVLTGAPHPGTELRVLQSAAGYYLGFRDKDGMPYSRESTYFPDEHTAAQVLAVLRPASYVQWDIAASNARQNEFMKRTQDWPNVDGPDENDI